MEVVEGGVLPLPHICVLQGVSSSLLSLLHANVPCIPLTQRGDRKGAVKFIYVFIILVPTSSIHQSPVV